MIIWIRKHPFGVYVFLTCAISWSFQVPLALEARGSIAAGIPAWVHHLASFGPLLAVVIVDGGDALRRYGTITLSLREKQTIGTSA